MPKKHQLLVSFTDGTHLSVTVQGWGFAQLLANGEIAGHQHAGVQAISPLSEEFTYAHFEGFFGEPAADDGRSVKFFLISKPGILGVGNGCFPGHPLHRLTYVGSGRSPP